MFNWDFKKIQTYKKASWRTGVQQNTACIATPFRQIDQKNHTGKKKHNLNVSHGRNEKKISAVQEDFWNGRIVFFFCFSLSGVCSSRPAAVTPCSPASTWPPTGFVWQTGLDKCVPGSLLNSGSCWSGCSSAARCGAGTAVSGGQGKKKQPLVSEAAFLLCRSKTVLHVLFTAVRAAPPKEHLLSKANEVFVVSVDVGELDVYQQQNLQHTEISSISERSR